MFIKSRNHRAGYRFYSLCHPVTRLLFSGLRVLLQRALKMKEIGARMFVTNVVVLYALSVADQFIKTGMYSNI